MRFAPILIAVISLGLMGLTFVPSPAAVETARAHGFSEDVISRGLQHSFERRLLFWGATLAELAWLLALVFRGWGRRVTKRCHHLARGRWLPTLLLAGLCYFAVQALLHL